MKQESFVRPAKEMLPVFPVHALQSIIPVGNLSGIAEFVQMRQPAAHLFLKGDCRKRHLGIA